MSTSLVCCFNGCDSPALTDMNKCAFHRNRLCCAIENCFNQVYARGLCVRHGGKKQCLVADCTANARTGGLCSRHGLTNTKKQCIEPNCANIAHANQRCVRHGGGRKCKVEECQTLARIAGYCQRHSKQLLSEPCSFDCDLLALMETEEWIANDVYLDTTYEALDDSILDCVLDSTRPYLA
ncbi:hypothetical protein SPRG_15967 [Saprolegnia parasitica CBS 223.65]|uniref:Uncharacterized protein n=1 Tax=Saprolegnia parasitica (strain CBS 223.65) TaxID=695850 RepID=A0A067BVK2_SAPPC|nr:hypothetical protein SPRG_15967 [Saprolegnia parasitica CBS 223.65]KDO18632.1 hypothetical protein SPRG_15967 [Saprolegnia parasitica CBS 223.65]|eukprot:XP_012210655.1 hypothetical protein SPRG_15967 [Saprolegnia parasitica CBS 223.65]